jgi:hypothetical protein
VLKGVILTPSSIYALLGAQNLDGLINDIAIKKLESDITYVRNTVGIVFPPTFNVSTCIPNPMIIATIWRPF